MSEHLAKLMKAHGNKKSTSIKRIFADMRELVTDASDQYYAAPTEENLFDWHFLVRGPKDTAFEGGIYHGRILLPNDYPMKPPNIILLTPNGRFEVHKKICLSISAYHPEQWQPSWGIRTMLEAIISFMPSKGEGAIGALDYTPEERKRLAVKSRTWKCTQGPWTGSVAKDVLEENTPSPEERAAELEAAGAAAAAAGAAAAGAAGGGGAAAAKRNKYADQVKAMHMHAATTHTLVRSPSEVSGAAAGGGGGDGKDDDQAARATQAARVAQTAQAAARVRNEVVRPPAAAAAAAAVAEPQGLLSDNALLTLAWALVVAIAVLIFRKVSKNM
eukprot:g514.t1